MSQPKFPKSWRRVLFVALLVAVLGASGWLVLRPQKPEPVYQGKTLSTWMEQYYRMGDESAYRNKNAGAPPPTNSAALREEAAIALREIGTNAIPYYLKLAATRISPMQMQIMYNKVFSKVSWRTPWLGTACYRWATEFSENPQKALLGFQLLGPAAKSTVPDLIHLMQTSDSRNSRRSAAYALSFIGPAAKDAVPALVQNFKDPYEMVRDATVTALFAIAQDHDTYRWRPECAAVMVPALSQLLSDTNTDVLRVVFMLSDLQGEARPAVPALMPFLNDTNVQISSATQNAIKSIDPEAAAKAGIR